MSDAPDTLVTSVNRKWSLKIGLFAAILLVFGGWGYYDAAVKYPERGAVAAEYLELRYLDAYGSARGFLDTKGVSIDDPVAVHRELGAQDAKDRSAVDAARFQWLDQLRMIGRLDPANTRIPRDDWFAKGVGQGGRIADAKSRYDTLQKAPPGKPLSAFDIPSQWLICACGFGFGFYLLALMVAVSRRRYRWEPAPQRLHLPGGASIVPADIEEFDKRKWDKFLLTLRIKPGHQALGGKAVTLDLLRYVPLEDWILAMERTAFPDAGEDATPDATSPTTT